MQDLTYGLALWVPYFGTGIRSSNPYSFRSTMAMAMGAGPDPRSKNVDFPAAGHGWPPNGGKSLPTFTETTSR